MVTCVGTDAYASKAAVDCTSTILPGSLVLHRGIMLSIPHISD